VSDVVDHVRDIPEVLEAHTTTGPGDLHCRVVAHTHEHLQEVINRMLEVQGIDRTTTVIALTEQISLQMLPLLDA
jgi:DNA-binding Lrp family transcriptional regulator